MRVVIGRESDPLNLHDIMILTLNITPEDIDKGERQSCNSCPIALSFIRGLEENEIRLLKGYVNVGENYINVTLSDEEWYSTRTSVEMKEFIHKFDSRLDAVEPFTSTLILERMP